MVAAAPSQSPPLLQEEAFRFLFVLPFGHIYRDDASRERGHNHHLGRHHHRWKRKVLTVGQWMGRTRCDPVATSGIRPPQRGRGHDRDTGGREDRGATGILEAEEIGRAAAVTGTWLYPSWMDL